MIFSSAGKRFRFHGLGLSISLALGSTFLHASDTIQFNTDVLNLSDRENIDLSQFSRSGYIMPGTYDLVVHINKNDIPEQAISFFPPEDDPKAAWPVCLRTWSGSLD